MLRLFLRRPILDKTLAGLVGALDNSVIDITCNSTGFRAGIKHEYIVEQYRVAGSISESSYFISNVFFELTGDAPEGLGLQSFARQVNAACRLGFPLSGPMPREVLKMRPALSGITFGQDMVLTLP